MVTMKEPEVNPSGRYSINDTAAKLGIARSTLLNWEKKGYIRSYLMRTGYRKFYTGIDILKCWRACV